jgi:hypothetical protein
MPARTGPAQVVPADRGAAVAAVVERARLQAAVEIAAAFGVCQRLPDRVEVAGDEVVERLEVRREPAVDLCALRDRGTGWEG